MTKTDMQLKQDIEAELRGALHRGPLLVRGRSVHDWRKNEQRQSI